MIVIAVSVTVQVERLVQFEQIIGEVQQTAQSMSGCLRYAWYRTPNTAQEYFIYGEFATSDHFTAYLDSSLVQQIQSELIPLLTTAPRFSHYHATVLEEQQD